MSLKLEQNERLPKGWERVPLKEICQLGGGKTPRKSTDKFWDGNTLWASPKDFSGSYLSETEDKLTEEGLQETSMNTYEPGDIALVVRSGVLKHTLPVAQLQCPATVNQDIKVLQPDADRIASDYLLSALLYESNRIRTSCAKTGTTVESIETDFLKAYKLPIPPLPEQRRIAAVLSTVDEQIQQTEAVIETAVDLKRGLIQKLVVGHGLSESYQEATLGPKEVDLPKDWRMDTFSGVAAIEKGNTPKTSNEAYYGGENVWVTPDDLSSLYERGEKYISDSRRKLTEAGLESTSVRVVESNSVMFTSRSFGIGKTAICTVPAATNQGIIAFNCNSEMSEEYMYYYLNWIMDYIISLSGVSTFPEVSKSDISSIPIPVPTAEDQQRIVKVLNRADQKIIRERTYKQKLHELKRGLMQDLLTGAVRVPESIEAED